MNKSEVFIEAVEDHLNGTPNARHPVQFSEEKRLIWPLSKCLFCFALVEAADHDDHREFHDNQNAELSRIMEQANRYVSPPVYGGSR